MATAIARCERRLAIAVLHVTHFAAIGLALPWQATTAGRIPAFTFRECLCQAKCACLCKLIVQQHQAGLCAGVLSSPGNLAADS